ncbi:MAG TPA: TonB-dependent receptor [Gemmatimonadales bacterium]|nr:TonB-dependent receptor [Gemmatimonadales bacterium]
MRVGTLVCACWLFLATIASAQTGGIAAESGAGTVQFFTASEGGGRPLQPVEAGRVPMLRRRISLVLRDEPLEDALAEIGRLSGVTFAYGSAALPADGRVSLRAEGMTLAAVLTETLLDAGVDVVVSSGDRLALVRHDPPPPVREPTGVITGVVTDSATGGPVESADVFVDSTSLATTTNAVGLFRLKAPPGHYVLRVRRLGYRPATVEVDVEDGVESAVAVTLEPQPTRLQELVSTVTGNRRRYELGNAIATINADSIVATQPVRSVTELLETRVPGLTATHTSGAPGDPTRLRLRGLNSISRSNDPIVIVDGVRMYSDQSDVQRGGNLAVVNTDDGRPITGRPNTGDVLTDKVAVRSPLDQIDPHSIATIEVFKGPSASTLYGADAANGVIVITTKRGQDGPTRWNFGTEAGLTYQPGHYPDSYVRWGHDVATGQQARCPLVAYNCVVDSLVTFQALNNPDLTVFGQGHRGAMNLGLSGGTEKVTYALNGSYSRETGLIKLPEYEVRRYTTLVGSDAPDWMQHPQGLTDWAATGHISVALAPNANLAFTSTVDRSMQRRSTLEEQIGALMTTYPDTANSLFYQGGSVNTGPGTPGGIFLINPTLVTGFRTKTTAGATSFTEAAHFDWRPLGWLSTTAELGLNVIDRDDESTQPYLAVDPYNNNSFDEIGGGFFNVGNGNSNLTTASLGAVGVLPLSRGWDIRTAVGGNYTRQRTNDLIASGRGLIQGAAGLDGAHEIVTTPQRSEVTTFGWYIEPTLESHRFWLTTGLRLDGADTYGSHQSLAGFPKVSLSYLVSDEPGFPLKKLFSTLRLRAAYGQAGVQPGPSDRLRLFQTTPGFLDGIGVSQSDLVNIGNVELKPERSSEFEGGIDADLFGDGLTLELTGYHKLRHDALVPVQLPPSVNGGGTVMVNVGEVRNTGFEIGVGVNPVRSDGFTLNAQMHLSRNTNTVVSTGPAGEINGPGGTKVVDGYPLFGRWARPIVHYADADGDGIISRSEVQLGDKDVFLGPAEPKYEAALYTNMSMARGMITLTTGFSYTDGQLQINDAVTSAPFTVRALNDPTAPLSEQAAAVVREETPYGLAQVISTFRFNSLALAFNAPAHMAGWLGARTASVMLQGTNLWLNTNYRGKDPNVNAYATGNVIADTGVLPMPRTWSLGLRFGF